MGSVEGLLSWGVALRFAAIGTYAAAFVSYAARLAVHKLKLDRAATALAALGVVTHTAYLVTRWIAAGQIEILAREQSGDVLSSYDRFWYMVSHPPYTNLFDALQSYWILIHVGMLFVSYSLFTLGAVCALLYLVRTGTPTAWLGGVQAAAAALLLALVGGFKLLFGATFEMAPGWQHQIQSRLHPGKLLDVTTAVHVMLPGSDKAVKYLTPVAGVGPFLLGAIALFIAGAALYYRDRGGPERGVSARGYKIVAAGFASLTVGLAYLIYKIVSSAEIVLPLDVHLAPGEHGPFRLSLASNYALGLIALVWGTTLGFLLTTPLRDRISEGLPDPRKLEDITYRVIIAGWPLLTIGIVMGGMWANEAWGRFWGWDPKETWALITWVVYAGYLHTRITLGWAGKRPAAIAVFAFAVVVFTFMGVNLGLTGEGLHTYGAG